MMDFPSFGRQQEAPAQSIAPMPSLFELKAAAVRAYDRFHRLLDDVDCGAHVLKYLNPEAQKAADEFNEAMGQLEMLDPRSPCWEAL